MVADFTRDGQFAQQRWNGRYEEARGIPQAAQVLRDNVHLLPTTGHALDLACGLGGNALLMAAHGLLTWAWDVSDVAIAQVRHNAQTRMLSVRAEVRDVVAAPPEPERFHVIMVSRFLERSLARCLVAALRPGGMLFYQTFTQLAVDDSGPQLVAYRLEPQELLKLFYPLRLVVYREEGKLGDMTQGTRHEVMYIGHKAQETTQRRNRR